MVEQRAERVDGDGGGMETLSGNSYLGEGGRQRYCVDKGIVENKEYPSFS